MLDKIVFFNQFGAGDIFESREFVKAWMKLVQANEYYYAHGKNPRILLDIPELKYTTITEEMNPRKQIWISGSTLFCNTWIGITGQYLLPGIGCTVERLYDMHNDMLRTHGLGQLSGNPVDYIPSIDYSYYYLDGCNHFLKEHPEEKIFIDNGLTQSLQAENFDINSAIVEVAKKFPDKTFIVAHRFEELADNIYPTDIITLLPDFDLPEISYLSTFCSILIGRNSGPHVFTQVKENVMNENKKLLSFTYRPTGASFVVNTPVKIKKYWSNATSKNQVVEIMERVINE